MDPTTPLHQDGDASETPLHQDGDASETPLHQDGDASGTPLQVPQKTYTRNSSCHLQGCMICRTPTNHVRNLEEALCTTEDASASPSSNVHSQPPDDHVFWTLTSAFKNAIQLDNTDLLSSLVKQYKHQLDTNLEFFDYDLSVLDAYDSTAKDIITTHTALSKPLPSSPPSQRPQPPHASFKPPKLIIESMEIPTLRLPQHFFLVPRAIINRTTTNLSLQDSLYTSPTSADHNNCGKVTTVETSSQDPPNSPEPPTKTGPTANVVTTTKTDPPIKADPPIKLGSPTNPGSPTNQDPPIEADPPIKLGSPTKPGSSNAPDPPIEPDPPINLGSPTNLDPPIEPDQPIEPDPPTNIGYPTSGTSPRNSYRNRGIELGSRPRNQLGAAQSKSSLMMNIEYHPIPAK